MNLLSILTLKKEARLFDAKEYLLKTFIAIVIGYSVGRSSSYLSKDMISLLFGLMMTLEPVNSTGIKSGLKQIEASILGAIVTGIIVGILGYNIWTVALGITATLYVSLLINWKDVPVVAVFTSIYMTQLVQLNAMGQPSEWLTFRLRIVSLGAGVLIAFLVNFIFSLVGYKKMIRKRLYFIMDVLVDKMKVICEALDGNDNEAIKNNMYQLPDVFNNIDWIRFTMMDMSSDKRILKNLYSDEDNYIIMSEIELLRGITHILYDMCYQRLLIEDNEIEYNEADYTRIISNAEVIKYLLEGKFNKRVNVGQEYKLLKINGNKNMEQLNESQDRLYGLIK